MGFFPYMFSFLLLLVVARGRVGHGVAKLTDAQIYWNNVLPNTPMPKAISVLLPPTGEKGPSIPFVLHGGVEHEVEKDTRVQNLLSWGGAKDEGEKDANVQNLLSWGGSKDEGEKDARVQNLLSWGVTKDEGEKDASVQNLLSWGGAKDEGEKDAHVQNLLSWGGAKDEGEKDARVQNLLSWGGAKDEGEKDARVQNLLSWGGVKDEGEKDARVQNLLSWGDAKDEGERDARVQNLLSWRGAKDEGEKDASVQNLLSWGGVKDEGEKDARVQNLLSWGSPKDEGEKDTHVQNLLSWGGAKDEGEKDVSVQNLLSWGGAKDEGEKDARVQNLLSWGGAKDEGEKDASIQNLLSWGGAKVQGEKGATKPLFNAGMNNLRQTDRGYHTSHSVEVLGDMYFLEKDFHPGKKMKTIITRDSSRSSHFMSQKLAESVPFSSTRYPYILNQFSVKPGSKEANMIQKSIQLCENAPIKGEEKHCATSLESMIDYVTSKLGTNNIQAISTEVGEGATRNADTYAITGRVKKLAMASDKSIVCHKTSYAFAIFVCHDIPNTRAYMVPLEGDDGSKANAIARCHVDTSTWNPNHVSFQKTKTKPGAGPICHFLPESDILWVRNHQSTGSAVA